LVVDDTVRRRQIEQAQRCLSKASAWDAAERQQNRDGQRDEGHSA